MKISAVLCENNRTVILANPIDIIRILRSIVNYGVVTLRRGNGGR